MLVNGVVLVSTLLFYCTECFRYCVSVNPVMHLQCSTDYMLYNRLLPNTVFTKYSYDGYYQIQISSCDTRDDVSYRLFHRFSWNWPNI